MIVTEKGSMLCNVETKQLTFSTPQEGIIVDAWYSQGGEYLIMLIKDDPEDPQNIHDHVMVIDLFTGQQYCQIISHYPDWHPWHVCISHGTIQIFGQTHNPFGTSTDYQIKVLSSVLPPTQNVVSALQNRKLGIRSNLFIPPSFPFVYHVHLVTEEAAEHFGVEEETLGVVDSQGAILGVDYDF